MMLSAMPLPSTVPSVRDWPPVHIDPVTTNWFAALAISALATTVMVVVARLSPKVPLQARRRLGVTGGFTLLFVTLLSDLPFGTKESAKFWADHALATGIVTSALLVGLGYLVVDARVEKERARVAEEREREFDDLLEAMTDDLLRSHTYYFVKKDFVVTQDVDMHTRLDHLDTSRRVARELCQQVGNMHGSATSWLTVIALAHNPRAIGLPRLLTRVRQDLERLRDAHENLVNELGSVHDNEPLGFVGAGFLGRALAQVDDAHADFKVALDQLVTAKHEAQGVEEPDLCAYFDFGSYVADDSACSAEIEPDGPVGPPR
jgi:hypothetical protein